MDHCSAAAIRGECPGVSAQDVLERKIAEIASATKELEEYVREMITYFDEMLTKEPKIKIGDEEVVDLRICYLGEGYSLHLLTAQVAILAAGKTALLRHRDTSEEAEKWSISGHASPNLIREFKEKWAPNQGLSRIYGVPDRGYAGGYIECYICHNGNAQNNCFKCSKPICNDHLVYQFKRHTCIRCASLDYYIKTHGVIETIENAFPGKPDEEK